MLRQFAHVFITELGTINKLDISREFYRLYISDIFLYFSDI